VHLQADAPIAQQIVLRYSINAINPAPSVAFILLSGNSGQDEAIRLPVKSAFVSHLSRPKSE